VNQYSGLTSAQVQTNQLKYGLNLLDKKKRLGFFVRLIKKISNPLLIILLFSSLLSFFLGQKTDFFIILIILLTSVILDIFQESQAEHAAEKLAQKISLVVRVFRDNQILNINTSQITVDDIILLSAGNIIPADCKLLEVQNLEVNQATLTGESFPVEKEVNDFILMGTSIVAGSAVAQVTAIGRSTQLGKISATLSRPRPKTDFEKGLNNFSLLLVKLTFVFAIVLFFINLLLGHPFISSLMFVLAIAIGFAPELLPMILTINLSKGSLRLSKHGVIVKFLPSIENFGSMDILCTDKTGTLTEGIMNIEASLNIFNQPDPEVLKFAYLNSFYQVGFHNPIDEAILKRKPVNLEKYQKVGEIAYNFYRRHSTVFLKQKKSCLLIAKGSSDSILPLCLNQRQIKFDLDKLNQQGFRTILVATKKLKLKNDYSESDETNLHCVGVLAFADPPKTDVLDTIKRLASLGVSLKILTGDSLLVTKNICQQIGLTIENTLTGSQIEKLSDEKLAQVVDQTTIFASLTPDQKLKIITALKQRGHVVGYLGDGINDAPSLKNADVGISVNNAIDVAKESADIILLRKDLHVLRLGIEEGRITFANIMKYILMGTSSTFGNMISLSLASIFLPFLPMLPVQLLLNDLLYDFSQMLLVKDRVDQIIINRPYQWSIQYIKKFMLVFGSVSSLFDLITFYILYGFLKSTPQVFQTGWFMESFFSQMLIIFSIRTTLIPFWKSKVSPIFALGILFITIIALSLPYSPFKTYLHFTTPPSIFLCLMFLIVVSYFILIEIIKYFFNHPTKINLTSTKS
jgi:Mg2+-importing ATPase